MDPYINPNYVMKTMKISDEDLLECLGPYDRILYQTLCSVEFVEEGKKEPIPSGITYHEPEDYIRHPMCFYNMTFMVFKPTKMKQECIQLWQSQIG